MLVVAAALIHLHGTVVAIDLKHNELMLRHDPSRLMPMEMTMPCRAKDPAALKALHKGSIVDVDADTDQEPWVLYHIRISKPQH